MKKSILLLALFLGGCSDFWEPPLSFFAEPTRPAEEISVPHIQSLTKTVCKFKPSADLIKATPGRTNAAKAIAICEVYNRKPPA